MAVFREFTFYNINSHEEFISSLAYAASNAGWVIDKIAGVELYLHSTGINGNQNLYYSLGFRYWPSVYINMFVVYGNTGFDSNRPIDNQPGKWVSCEMIGYQTMPYSPPIAVLKVFANSWFILVQTWSHTDPKLANYFTWFMIGTIELYKTDYTQCNTCSTAYVYYGRDYGFTLSTIHTLFENQTKTARSSLTVQAQQNYSPSFANTSSFHYNNAVTAHPVTNKTILLKPVISVSHSIGGYNYFFPVGELPIYVTRAYPYFFPYDLSTYGSRVFRIIPFFYKTDSIGLAIEIESP